MRPGRLESHIWPLAIASAVVVAAMYVLPSRLAGSPIAPDFLHGYYPGALSIAAGDGYRTIEGAPITHWPPGYSLFISPWVSADIAATMRNLTLLNAGLGVAFVALITWLSRRIAPTESLWLTLPLALATPLLVLSSPSLSEMLFALLTTGALCLLMIGIGTEGAYGRRAAVLALVSGLLIGYAALVKTTGVALALGLGLALVLSPVRISWRERLLRPTIFAAGATAVIVPWILTYKSMTGQPGFTSAGVGSMIDGIGGYPHIRAGAELFAASASWEGGSDYLATVAHLLVQDPLSTLHLFGTKATQVWYATASGRFDSVLFLVQGPWLLMFCAVILWWARQHRRLSADLVLAFAAVLTTWAVGVLAHSIFRYLAPVFPLVPLLVLRTYRELRTPRTASVKQGAAG